MLEYDAPYIGPDGSNWRQLVPYHGERWGQLVESGWRTETVENGQATMIYCPPLPRRGGW